MLGLLGYVKKNAAVVPGPWSLVPDPWSLVLGPWSLVPAWSLVPGASSIPVPWSLQVPGPWSWSLVPGPCITQGYLDLVIFVGAWNLVPCATNTFAAIQGAVAQWLGHFMGYHLALQCCSLASCPRLA